MIIFVSKPAMSCSNYKDFTLNYCPDSFLIQTLAASTLFIWKLTGKFNNSYRGIAVTDADGVLTVPIDTEDTTLTKDMFQPFSGPWEFRAFTLGEAGEEIPVVFCGTYDFLVFSFERVSPLPEPNNVGVDLACGDDA
jgi:hypothetical protein